MRDRKLPGLAHPRQLDQLRTAVNFDLCRGDIRPADPCRDAMDPISSKGPALGETIAVQDQAVLGAVELEALGHVGEQALMR